MFQSHSKPVFAAESSGLRGPAAGAGLAHPGLNTSLTELRKIFPTNTQNVFAARNLLDNPLTPGELGQLDEVVGSLLRKRGFNAAQPLDLLDPTLDLCKFIFKGQDYYQNGPVTIGSHHLSMIISGFAAPDAAEIDARTAIGKANYGTIPGLECAYLGAIAKALRPRTILCIGEHTGNLTHYIAQQADDAVIFSVDLLQRDFKRTGVMAPGPIDMEYVKHSDTDIGNSWREADATVSDRIIQIFCDSTSLAMSDVASALKGKIDLVIVDGGHSFDVCKKDLQTAMKVATAGAVIAVDDFLKPARLFEVTEAVLNARRENPKFKLHHINWSPPDPAQQLKTNLAFFVAP